jgi:polyisoprenoid-binding protein YceI
MSFTKKARTAMKALLASTLLAQGVASAATVTYEIDPNHTYPSFEADHMGISIWRGKLNQSKGKITLDKAAGSGSVEVSIDLASIDFGQDDLNKWARGTDFFDTARNPRATYNGTLEGFSNGIPSKVVGKLTLHGVTRPVELKINSFKCVPHPMLKREVCGADALATFNREEFGLTAGKDYGFRMDVTLRIQVEAIASGKAS